MVALAEQALQKILPHGIAVTAFDASADEPRSLTNFVLDRISAVRSAQVTASAATIAAIDAMIENRAEAAALAALGEVSDRLDRFADRNVSLCRPRRQSFERLQTAVNTLHPRTVWAATRRAGRFWNFDVFQYLGDGAAAEAKFRSSEVVAGLTAIIESDMGDPELIIAQDFLMQSQVTAALWEADFVNAARHHASLVYLEPLGRSQSFWTECEAEYGLGTGYKPRVAEKLRDWFEENEARDKGRKSNSSLMSCRPNPRRVMKRLGLAG